MRKGVRQLASSLLPLLLALTGATLATAPIAVQADSCGSLPGSPNVTGWGPDAGDAGSTVVTIYGSGFGNATNGVVSFGNVNAQVQKWTDSEVDVIAPVGGTSGPVYICSSTYQNVVGMPNGERFTYNPHVSGLSRSQGFEGDTLTVTGSYFGGTGSVSFGSATAGCPSPGASVGSWSASQITVVVPRGQCSAPVRVTVPKLDGGSITSPETNDVFTELPHITNVSPASSWVGGPPFVVSGSGFGYAAGSVTLGGEDETSNSRWSDQSISIPVPTDIDQGGIQVSVNGHSDAWSSAVQVLPHIDSVSPSNPSPGAAITINGSGFGNNPGSIQLGSESLPVLSWSMTSVAARVPSCAPGGLSVVKSTGLPSINQAALHFQPQVSSVSPSSGGAGSVVSISGSCFGASQGSGGVTIDGVPASIALWSDNAVAAVVPSGISSGALVFTTAFGSIGARQYFTVTAAQSGSSLGSAGPAAPPCDTPSCQQAPSVTGWRKPPKPPSPFDLTVTAAQHNAAPGSTVDVTAVLTLNHKGISGSTIDFRILTAPGSDATVSPVSGVTDGNGAVHVKFHISRKPGANIIEASSGLFSDQDRIIGGTVGILPGIPLPASLTIFGLHFSTGVVPYAAGASFALLLIIGGLLLQFDPFHRRRLARARRAAAARP